MCGSAGAIHCIDHSCLHLLDCFRRKVDVLFRTHLVGGDDLVIETLHLLHQPRLIERSAVRDYAIACAICNGVTRRSPWPIDRFAMSPLSNFRPCVAFMY